MRKWLVVWMLLIGMITGAVAGEVKGKIRLGYWTSGVSLPFGRVLEAKRFLEKDGIDVEYIRFSDPPSSLKALTTGDIDIAFGIPLSNFFSAVHDGTPLKLVAAVQLADAVVVAPEDSSVRTWQDLKGKKVGGTYPSATIVIIANTIAEKKYGLEPGDYSIVSGNESRLAQFLVQKQIDASILRSITYENLKNKIKLRKLGALKDEWENVSGSPAAPYIGMGVAREEFINKYPDLVSSAIRSWIRVEKWGAAHKKEVADILKEHAGFTPENADNVAARWGDMYHVALDPATLKTLETEHDVFVRAGVIKGQFGRNLYVTEPYRKATDAR
ncbi:ABC transporter substrate-binding protein [Oxalobacter aliiformigenes]|uniref:ABC transporter substrate-binding protein n=1 Tax=Oxalobacter aliiformigenes TaxID=2946593 RepID=UPI0022AFD31C|nr:ABC transporter substrate-binding protein [Oxalobacter aliiformigenes]MCZ4064639.1 ABC transporter substrate-binding protein [Oxalobacter aliiformigenes]WAV99114.1 ABC transporter substrate-binding protein [Oxalobacter aliiformigenes]